MAKQMDKNLSNRSTNDCDITRDNILDKMIERGVRSEEIYNPSWPLPSWFLKAGVGISISKLAERITANLQSSNSRMVHNRENAEGGISADVKLVGVELKATKDGHINFAAILEGSITYDQKEISGKFKMKFIRGGIDLGIFKLESRDTGYQVVYDLRLNLEGKNIDWAFSKITMVIPNKIKDALISILSRFFDTEILLHSMSFDKNMDMPSLDEGKSVTIKSPLPKAKNIHYTTNAYYDTLIIGWTAGTSGMRNDDIKRISKNVYKSGKFMQVVFSPNFLYDEISEVFKAFFGHFPLLHPVNAQTVLIGGGNVYGVSVNDVKFKGTDIELIKALFTSKDAQLAALAQVKGKKFDAHADLGFCIDFNIGPLKGQKQEISVHIVEGYEHIQLAWWQKAIIAVFSGVFFPVALAIVGALVHKKLADLRDNTVTFEYTLTDYAILKDISVTPTPHFGKNSYWIAVNFDAS